jgi:hypothetical protein
MVGFFDGMAEQMVNFVYPNVVAGHRQRRVRQHDRGEPGGVAQSVGQLTNRTRSKTLRIAACAGGGHACHRQGRLLAIGACARLKRRR